MSFNDPATNDAWAVQEGFQYELWTDQQRELALYYGTATSPTQSSASRQTFLIDGDGDLLLEYPSISIGVHPQQVLDDCQALFGN